MKKTIKNNIVINLLYQVLVMIIPFISTPYITRTLGANAIGRYSFSYSIATYFVMFSSLGTLSYGTREISRARDDIYKRSVLFWSIELLTVITTSICVIAWLVFILISKENKTIFVVLSLNILTVYFDITWFYTGIEEYLNIIIPNAFFKILGVVMIFVFVKNETDFIKYCLIIGLTTFLGTLTMWVRLKKYVVKVSVSNIKLFGHFRQTLVYFIPTIVTSLYTVLDKTLIGVITKDTYENGYYEEATNILNALKVLTFTSMNVVLGARMSYLYSLNKIEEIKEKIRESINFILFVGLGLGFILVAMADRVIVFYLGTGFERTAIFIKYMSPLVVIVGISNCLGSLFYNPVGLRKESAKYILFGAIINLSFNIILIPYLSGIGAIISTVLSETIISLLYIINSRGVITFGIILKNGWKKLISAGVLYLVLIKIGEDITNNIVFIIVESVLGIVTYVFMLIFLKDSLIYSFLKKIMK